MWLRGVPEFFKIFRVEVIRIVVWSFIEFQAEKDAKEEFDRAQNVVRIEYFQQHVLGCFKDAIKFSEDK